MTQEQKNARFENALQKRAAQALAERDMRCPGAIDTLQEIAFTWRYVPDPKGTSTRSVVEITDEIRERARVYQQQWEENYEQLM